MKRQGREDNGDERERKGREQRQFRRGGKGGEGWKRAWLREVKDIEKGLERKKGSGRNDEKGEEGSSPNSTANHRDF